MQQRTRIGVGLVAGLLVIVLALIGGYALLNKSKADVSQATQHVLESRLKTLNKKVTTDTAQVGKQLSRPALKTDKAVALKKNLDERNKLLESLIVKNPDAALQLSLTDSSYIKLPPKGRASSERRTTVEGTIEAYYTDNFKDKKSEETYNLVTNNKEKISLSFPARVDKPTHGSSVKVTGVKVKHKMAVDKIERTKSQAENSLGTKKIAIFLVNFQNKSDKPYTKEEVYNQVFTRKDSVKEFYKEASYNQLNLEGEVFDWYTVPFNNSYCEYWKWSENVTSTASSRGIDLSAFENYAFIFNKPDGCRWGGLGQVGGHYFWQAQFNSINNSSAYYEQDAKLFRYIFAHELGHNLGVMHANSIECYKLPGSQGYGYLGTNIATILPINNYCKTSEYNDSNDVMGNGSINHFNAAFKRTFLWLKNHNSQVATRDGIYTIKPLETSINSSQALIIPRGETTLLYKNNFYVEMRKRTGFDTNIKSNIDKGLLVRLVPESGSGSRPTFLVNSIPTQGSLYVPSYFEPKPLEIGKSIFDPTTGISIKTVSVSATEAKVEVKFGKPTVVTPKLTISEPDGVNDTLTIGRSYPFKFTLTSPETEAYASFGLDKDNKAKEKKNYYDYIYLQTDQDCGSWSTEGTNITCNWKPDYIESGKYYIWGMSYDNHNPQEKVYSKGQVTVKDGWSAIYANAYIQGGYDWDSGIAGAKITITGPKTYTVYTNDYGQATFPYLTSGTWNVGISANGYKPQASQTVTIKKAGTPSYIGFSLEKQ